MSNLGCRDLIISSRDSLVDWLVGEYFKYNFLFCAMDLVCFSSGFWIFNLTLATILTHRNHKGFSVLFGCSVAED